MGYAYEWLTERDKNNILTIVIEYAMNKICIELCISGDIWRLVYTPDFEGITRVAEARQDAWVNKYFLDVACEDFDSLVVNQKSKLKVLRVEPVYPTDSDQKALDPIISKIFEHLSKSLACRSSPLQVNSFYVISTKVSERMSVIRHLDHSELDWIDLDLRPKILTRQDLEIVNKIASSQRFDIIQVSFHSCEEENIETFFDTKLFDFKVDERRFRILPLIERPNPLFDEQKIKAAKLELIKSSLPENMALGVLGNSVIMEVILEELQFFDIQRLRKVCRGVRECIDDVKPEHQISAYEIDVNPDRISVIIESKYEARRIDYEYEKDAHNDFHMNLMHQKTCLDEDEKRALIDFPLNRMDEETCLYDECGISVNTRSESEARRIKYNFLRYEKRARNDFHTNLSHQKTCLEELRIRLHVRFIQQVRSGYFTPWEFVMLAYEIGGVLRRRKTALKVETFWMDFTDVGAVMEILPYIDKDFLKKIVIAHQPSSISILATNLVEIARTAQWKRASELWLIVATVITPIQHMNITHFSTVYIRMQTLSSDEIVYLKTELLNSSTLEKFRIKFKTSTIDERLHNLIGEPYRNIRDVKKIWYFRMSNPDYYLHIVLDTQNLLDEEGNPKPKTIAFSKVAKEDTPFL